MQFSWYMVNGDLMQVELTVNAHTAADNAYVAIGFSSDDMMGDDSVIECSALGNDPLSLKLSFNVNSTTDPTSGGEPTNWRLSSTGSAFFLNSSVAIEDGVMYCHATLNVTGASAAGLLQFSPDTYYYLLMANGPTNGAGLLHHVHDVTSATPLALQNSNAPTIECSSISSEALSMKFSYINNNNVNVRIPGEPENFDANGCGNDKVCVLPTSCYGGCNGMGFSYKMVSSSFMHIELFATLSAGNQYIAVGFSNDALMGDDHVIECSALVNESFSLKFSYNNNSPKNVRIPGEQGIRSSYFTFGSVSNSDAQLYCTALVNVSGWSGSSEVFRYNPRQQYYLLLASGFTDANGLVVHKHTFVSSSRLLGDLGGNADSVLSLSQILFELSMKTDATSSIYLALGFSDDNKMQIESLYFRNETAKIADGVMYCSAVVNVSGWSGSSQVFTYDPKKTYYLLLASGVTTASGLARHKITAVSTPRLLSDYESSGSSGMSPATKQRLVKAHAILMILSWFFFVPTAVMFARFLRSSWPIVKPGGLLIWFHVHRSFNLLALALNISSFICILTANNWTWTGPATAVCIAADHFDFLWSYKVAQIVLSVIPLALLIVLSAVFFAIDKVKMDEFNFEKVHQLRQHLVVVGVVIVAGVAITLSTFVGIGT
ncbi:hypothetical protein Q1695_012169 [Nippostrongylus brasiliensis]|nr:hypothetical protein Q1695_012169 [Nippostrongylus brasiliensis]